MIVSVVILSHISELCELVCLEQMVVKLTNWSFQKIQFRNLPNKNIPDKAKVRRRVLKFKLVTKEGGISTARLLLSQRSEGDREDSLGRG